VRGRSSSLVGRCPYELSNILNYQARQSFLRFLEHNCSPKLARVRLNYALKYGHLLFSGNLSVLHSFSDSKRNHILKSLSALSKFLGVYDEFQRLRRKYDIKWSSGRVDLLIIKRLLKRYNGDNLKEWVNNVKSKVPTLSLYIDFIMASGLRHGEAINSWNLIIGLCSRNRLNKYYKDCMLEHYRFPDIFIRRTKKVFLSIVPEYIVERIARSETLTTTKIRKRLFRKGLNERFSDIREYWASVMTRYLSQPEIDFLQGRISASVFMANYFNPMFIDDLKERTLKGIDNLLL